MSISAITRDTHGEQIQDQNGHLDIFPMVSDAEVNSSQSLSHYFEPPSVETNCVFNTCPSPHANYAPLLITPGPRNPPNSADTSANSSTNFETTLYTRLNYGVEGPSLQESLESHVIPLRRGSISGLGSRARAKFTLEEDQLILRLRGNGRTWKEIATKLPGRSPGALQVRFSTKLKFKTVIWNTDIDQQIEDALLKYEQQQWIFVSTQLGGGISPEECRERSFGKFRLEMSYTK